MAPSNLLPGQYQIDDLIMGRGTVYRVGAFDIQPYGVQAGDYQIPTQDQNMFGMDQHIPGPINITLQLLQNRWTHKVISGTVLKSAEAGKLARIWRADGVRRNWGETQALYFGANNGSQKVIFGRTGKFQYPRYNEETEAFECVVEFRRLDNFAYSAHEYGMNFGVNQAPALVTNGTFGDGPSWMTLYLQGPMNDATVTVGNFEFQLDWDIPAGKILEINSHPWTRRCVDSDGINRRQNLIGPTPYLDLLRFNYNESLSIQCLANGTTGASKGQIIFRDGFQVID